MIWGMDSVEAFSGLLASFLSLLSSLFGFLKIGTKKWHVPKLGLLYLGILAAISVYAASITIAYINQERTLNDRLRINEVRQRLYNKILPAYVEVVRDTSDIISLQRTLDDVLKDCKDAYVDLDRVRISHGGSAGNSLQIYKYDNSSYLLVLIASLHHRLGEPGKCIDALTKAKDAVKEVRTQLTVIEETYRQSHNGKIQKIIDWTQSDGIKNRMHYFSAWIIALQRLNNLNDIPVAQFELNVRQIEKEYLRKYPLRDNYDMRQFLEENNENLGPEFRDYIDQLYNFNNNQPGTTQQDST